MGAIDVRDEMRARAVMERRKRQRRHHGAEIGTANADIDDVGNLLTGRTLQRTGTDRLGKLAHGGENGVHIGHHVLALHENRRVGAIAQRSMQHGAVFGEVDRLAREHLLALCLDATFACELFEKRDDLLIHGAFGIVHQQVIEFGAETAESLVVGRKGGAKIGCGCAARRCFQFFDGGLHLVLLGFRGRMRKLFFFRRPNQGDFDKRKGPGRKKEPVARLSPLRETISSDCAIRAARFCRHSISATRCGTR